MSGKANQTEIGQFDEVRTVVQAYDNLRTQQKAYERELTEIKEGLEQSVEKRTRDLRFEKDRVEEALEDLTRTQARLVQSEKMASLGQLTAGIAHEIKNPLNFVNNFASLSNDLLSELEAGLKDEVSRLSKEDREDVEDLLATLSSNLQKINHHGRRADSIVKNMLSHSRDESGAISEVNINSVVEEAIGLVYHAARAEKADFNITIEREFSEKIPPVACYLQEISRVLINIMSNGMYAANKRHQDADSGEEPRLVVRTEFENESCFIKIEDNGDGIPVEDREKIFEPFYTTKPAGDGTGLGLSLSFEIVETQHGGHLTVDSKVGDYTCFTISIPVAVDGADTSERVS